MNHEKHPERLSMENELKDQLAIAPSAELQARIRARTSEAVPKRIGWFPLGFGLAAASAFAIVLVVLNSAPESPARSVNEPSSPVVAATVTSVAEPPPAPIVLKVSSRDAPMPLLVVTPEATPSFTGLEVASIELEPLMPMDLSSALSPIPQPAFAAFRIEPMKLEPLALGIRAEGVNE